MADVEKRAEKMVQHNTKVIQNQETYQREYNELVAKYENYKVSFLRNKAHFNEEENKV